MSHVLRADSPKVGSCDEHSDVMAVALSSLG